MKNNTLITIDFEELQEVLEQLLINTTEKDYEESYKLVYEFTDKVHIIDNGEYENEVEYLRGQLDFCNEKLKNVYETEIEVRRQLIYMREIQPFTLMENEKLREEKK